MRYTLIKKKYYRFLLFLFTDDKYSITSELTFSAGINSSNFEIEKPSLVKSIHGILVKGAPYLKASDIELTFKKDLEFRTLSRIQTSTSSIVVMKVGPFNDNDAREIRDFVDRKLFDTFKNENMNPALVLDEITTASK